MELKSVDYLAERYNYLDTLLKKNEISLVVADEYRKIYYKKAKIMYEQEIAEAEIKWNTKK